LLTADYEQLVGEYFDFLTLDALLGDPGTLRRFRQQVETKSTVVPSLALRPVSNKDAWKYFSPRSSSALAAIVACLLIAAWVWRSGSYSQHAKLVVVEQAQWSDGRDRDVGEVLAGEWLELESGTMQVLFDSGAHATFISPTRFRTQSGNSCEIKYGELAVYAPDAAHGFRVVGPGYVVTDLGTSFRVASSPESEVQLRVTEGAVELDHISSSQTQELIAGDTVVFSAHSAPRKMVADDTTLSVRGGMQFLRTHPRSLGRGKFRKDGRLAVFLERPGVRLHDDQPLDLVSSGRHTQFEPRQSVAKGTAVDVYLIHFAPTRRGVAEGNIRFAGKIVGVICESAQLNATNSTLGDTNTLRCQHPERGLELSHNPNSDVVTISKDRRKLTVACRAESIDQLRVLVQTAPADTQ